LRSAQREGQLTVEKITLSVIKANVGGFVGNADTHEDVLEKARESLSKASSKGLLIDSWTAAAATTWRSMMTHEKGVESKDIHKLAWETFTACAEVAEKLHLYNPAQDLLLRDFNGTLRGLGPASPRLAFRERPCESFIVFLADKCELGAWNLPLYKMFADPFNTAGLVIDPSMHEGLRVRDPRHRREQDPDAPVPRRPLRPDHVPRLARPVRRSTRSSAASTAWSPRSPPGRGRSASATRPAPTTRS
jgi:hypothetical protein